MRREHAFFPAGKKNGFELQALCGVDGHDRDLVRFVSGIVVHDQADMFEERAERVIFFHGSGQLGKVFEPARALRRTIGLKGGRVTGFIEH